MKVKKLEPNLEPNPDGGGVPGGGETHPIVSVKKVYKLSLSARRNTGFGWDTAWPHRSIHRHPHPHHHHHHKKLLPAWPPKETPARLISHPGKKRLLLA